MTRVTHLLDKSSEILVSGSDLLKKWRNYILVDRHSAILISYSDLLKH